MLKKLMKYEFRDTAKLMFVTYAALALATLMGALALHQLDRAERPDTQTGQIFNLLWIACLTIYIFAIVGIYAGNFIYLCYRYFKSTYSTQGYLTHTLPVSPVSVFNSKLFTAFLWMIISSVLMTLSVLIMLSLGTGENVFLLIGRIDWEDFWGSGFAKMGISPVYFLTAMFLDLFIGLMHFILFVYASLAIGQLFNTNRIGFSILAGFVLYLLNQFLSTILLFAIGYGDFFSLIGTSYSEAGKHLTASINFSLLYLIATTVLLYALCIFINKRKLNLE